MVRWKTFTPVYTCEAKFRRTTRGWHCIFYMPYNYG